MRRFVLRSHYSTGAYDGNFFQYVKCLFGYHFWENASRGEVARASDVIIFSCFRCSVPGHRFGLVDPTVQDLNKSAKKVLKLHFRGTYGFGWLGRIEPTFLKTKPNILIRWFYQWFCEIPKSAIKDTNGVWHNPDLVKRG